MPVKKNSELKNKEISNKKSSELKAKEKKNSNKDNEDLFIPNEIMEKIPEDQREKLVSVIRERTFMGIMKQSHSLSEKLTDNHITDIIKYSDEEDKRDRIERKQERNYNIRILIIVLLVIVGLIIYLVEKQEKNLLDSIIGAI